MNPVNSNQSELIRYYNPNESGQSEFFGIIPIDRIYSDWKFGLILINYDLAGFNRIDF